MVSRSELKWERRWIDLCGINELILGKCMQHWSFSSSNQFHSHCTFKIIKNIYNCLSFFLFGMVFACLHFKDRLIAFGNLEKEKYNNHIRMSFKPSINNPLKKNESRFSIFLTRDRLTFFSFFFQTNILIWELSIRNMKTSGKECTNQTNTRTEERMSCPQEVS